MFRMIPDPGSQQRVTLSLESISTIPFQARASDVKIPKLRQHSFNRGMPGFVTVFGTFLGTWDQPDRKGGALSRYAAAIFWNNTNCEILRPGMLIARKIGQVNLVRCTHDWHNRHSGRRLILCIPPPIARIHLAVDSTTVRVNEEHLKWEMCQNELDTFENISVV